MSYFRLAAALSLALAAAGLLRAEDKTDPKLDMKVDKSFVPMFNGKDLSGWVNVNCAPGTFFVKDGEIITTGKPTGYLRTAKQYENFIADFEWMHVNKTTVGNSGFFVWADPLPAVGTGYTRGIEVQVLVNLEKAGYYTSQGDLFSIHGATCKPDRPHPHGWMRCLPSENRTKGGGEWNHYQVIAKDGAIKLHVNGKEVSGVSQCRPRKGYLALESEGAECHFRNLKIKELPSTNPKPDEVADVAQGFTKLFTGLDLSGWKADDEARNHWRPRDWILHYDGQGSALQTEGQYGDAEFIVDFRFPAKKDGMPAPCAFTLRQAENAEVKLTLTAEGTVVITTPGNKTTDTNLGINLAGKWHRLRAELAKDTIRVRVNDVNKKLVLNSGISLKAPVTPAKGALVLRPEGEMDFGNLFVRELTK
jgi:hypothetical protein